MSDATSNTPSEKLPCPCKKCLGSEKKLALRTIREHLAKYGLNSARTRSANAAEDPVDANSSEVDEPDLSRRHHDFDEDDGTSVAASVRSEDSPDDSGLESSDDSDSDNDDQAIDVHRADMGWDGPKADFKDRRRVSTNECRPPDDLAKKMLRRYEKDQSALDAHAIADLVAFKLATDHSLSRSLREDYQQAHNTSSDYKLKRLIEECSGIEVRRIHCCPKGHVAFTGPYKNATVCPVAGCKRYQEINGRIIRDKPLATYSYVSPSSLIAMLQRDPAYARLTRYRHQHLAELRQAKENGANLGYSDIYGSEHYQDLAERFVAVHRPVWSRVPGRDGLIVIDEHEHEDDVNHKYFDGTIDAVFGLFTDGVQLFHARGNNDCWPVILVNYSLPPDERFKTQNVLPVMMIPGPHQPRDLDSFLEPLYEEARNAAMNGKWVVDPIGGSANPLGQLPHEDEKPVVMLQRWYLYLVGADTPAAAKVMGMKGANAHCPCRVCMITGIPLTLRHPAVNSEQPERTSTHFYYPCMHRQGWPARVQQPNAVDVNELQHLHRREEDYFEQAYGAARDSKGAAGKLTGHNKVPGVAFVPGIDMVKSFPIDFMHAVFENLIKNLVALWKGAVKAPGAAPWLVSPADWDAVGKEMEDSGSLVPSAFGRRPCNIAQHPSWMTAEDWVNFVLYIGPALLEDRLPRKYFEHFLRMRNWVKACLRLSMDRQDVEGRDEVDAPDSRRGILSRKIKEWYEEYEA